MTARSLFGLAIGMLFVLMPLSLGQAEQDPKLLAKTAQQAFDRAEWPKAITLYRQLVELDPANALGWHHLGYAQHMTGDLDAAIKTHEKASTFPSVAATASYNVACVHALKGRTDKAFEWLDKAVAAGFKNPNQLLQDTDLASLHADPRFNKLTRDLTKAMAHGKTAKAYVQRGERKAIRLSYWGDHGAAGQVAVAWGPVAWKPEYDESLKAGQYSGRRWRLGADFWTTFDTNLPLLVGEQRIEPGLYYLALERKKDGTSALVFLDPKVIREARIDPFLAHLTRGGIEVALEAVPTESVQKQLDLILATKGSGPAKLVLRFGPHKLAMTFTALLED